MLAANVNSRVWPALVEKAGLRSEHQRSVLTVNQQRAVSVSALVIQESLLLYTHSRTS